MKQGPTLLTMLGQPPGLVHPVLSQVSR